MRTIQRRRTTERRIDGRQLPFFDRLESRTVLSGTTFGSGFSFNPPGQNSSPVDTTPLSITSTTPANSSTLSASPTVLEVTFSEPLNGFSIGLADFELVHLNGDGTTKPLLESEAQLEESLDFSNDSQDQIDLTLNRPLTDGSYELILRGNNQLAGTDGSQVADNGQDEVVSRFTIAPPSTGLANPTNLGTIGTTMISEPGELNLAANLGEVNYYRLTLAPGHHWQLGLAVDSVGEIESVATTLSLFNAQGQLVATSSTGLANDPTDPFLFSGLDPGTYEVGISAQGNIPDASGKYNPSQAAIQNPLTGHGLGRYQLQVVADPADQPTQVLGIRVDHADPLTTLPTGLTIQFSGAIQPAGLAQADNPPLKLVDQNGKAWGVTTVGYNPTLGQLQLVFDQNLPTGNYTLELTSSTSLLDLADDVPVATGLPVGELATFAVGTSTPAPTNDLGPIFPGQDSSSQTSTLTIDSKSSTTSQFVVIAPGVYAIEGIAPSSGLSYTLTDTTGKLVASGPQQSSSGTEDLTLGNGVYTLTITNPNGQSVDVPLILFHKVTDFSQLMEGGIAQGAALNLRLVSPQTDFGSSSVSSTPIALDNSSGSTATSSTSSSGLSITTGNSGSITINDSTSSGSISVTVTGLNSPSAQNLLYGFGPIGFPSSQSNQISVVGPTGVSGSFALASNGPGLSSGLIGIPETNSNGMSRESRSRSETEPEIPEPVPESEGVVNQRGITSTEAGLLTRTPQSRKADDQSLARAEWINGLMTRTVGWVSELNEPAPQPPVQAAAVASIPTDLGGVVPIDESPVESASVLSPISLGAVLMTLAYRYRRFFRLTIPRPEWKSTSVVHPNQPRLLGSHRAIRQSHRVC